MQSTGDRKRSKGWAVCSWYSVAELGMRLGLEYGEAVVEVRICSLPACIPGQSAYGFPGS